MKAKEYLLLIIFISSILSAQIKKDYRSLGTGVPVDLAISTNWEYFDGFNWISANQAPCLVDGVETAKSGNTIYIQENDTWNCSANVTVPTGTNIDFKGITGMGFGIAAGEFKTTFNRPSTIFFSAASGTIPYNSYANITIPAGSSYTYTGGTLLTAWASTVTVDGTLTLNSTANYYFTIGTAPLSQTSIGSSYLLGNGIINGSEKIRFGGDATTKPIICNFTGAIGLATTGVLVNGSVQLESNLTSAGMFYFVNDNIFVDLNGSLLQAKSLNGTASRINFKNTSPGSLTVSSQAAGLGSADGMPFRNITLNSGSTTINSDIIVENLFTNGAILSAISARIIHIPTIHDDLGGTIGTNVTVKKDIVNALNQINHESFRVISKIESDYLTVGNTEITGMLYVQFIDISGKIQLKTRIENNSRVYIGNLAKGIYMVAVTQNDKFSVQRFIK